MVRMSVGLAALLIGGCAVLQLDVDVYKGPLSNQEEVQQQQLAVMASSAKPLLIALRDQTEWPGGRLPGGYKADYMPSYQWTRPYAKRVNAVLSLYRDALPSELVKFAEEAEKHRAIYTVNVRALVRQDPLDRQADAQFWARIRPKLKYPGPDIGTETFVNEVGDIQEGRCEKLPRALAVMLAVRLLLDSNARESHGYPSYALRQVMPCMGSDIRPPDESANALFMSLADPGKQRSYATLLFSSPDIPEATEFMARLSAVGEAYLTARRELDGLLHDSLDMLRTLDLPAYEQLDKEQPAVRRGLGHLTANLIQPKSLVTSLCIPGYWERQDLYKTLLNRVGTEFPPCTLEGEWVKWNPDQFDTANRTVEALLLRDPQTTTQLILAADTALRKVKSPTITCDLDRSSVAPPEPRPGPLVVCNGTPPANLPFGAEFKFGVTRGPTLSPEETAKFLAAAEESFQLISDVGAQGLERGRLPEGLETLIDRYLKESVVCRDARHKAADSPREYEQPVDPQDRPSLRCDPQHWVDLRQKLGNSLVHFSEKLLFIANNDVLLASGRTENEASAGEPGSSPDTDTTPAATPDWKHVISGKSGPDGGSDRERRRYTLVFQAIGNSILNQLDELRARREHAGELELRADVELETLKRALSQAPKSIVEKLVADLRASASDAGVRVASSKEIVTKIQSGGLDADLSSAKADLAKAVAAGATATAELATARTQASPINATHVTLSGDGSAEAKEDLGKLKQAAITGKPDDPDATGPKMAEDIASWLDGQIQAYDSNFQTQPRPARLTAARDYLRSRRAGVGPADAQPRDETFKAIADNIAMNKAAADAAVAEKQRNVDTATALVGEATAKVDSVQNAIRTASSELAAAQTAIKKDQTSQTSYQHAANMVESHERTILAAFPDEQPVDVSKVFAKTISVLQADKAASACAKTAPPPDSAPLCDAISVMKAHGAPAGSDEVYTGPVNHDRGENAEDVLDRLIAALHYRQIQIQQQQQGPDSSSVRQVADAIQSAYEYRSGMAYLRPAGAYLRNSYPATSLQADPGLGWRNRLGDQMLRSIPFAGFLMNQTAPQAAADLKIQSEIDKQFWQNINTVRVAGAGATNYVLAKDDIGNWYVKAYSADPQPIIDAAKSLAMFSLGATSATAALPGPAPAAQSAQSANAVTAAVQGASATAGTNKAAPAMSPLEKMLSLHATKYETQTQTQYDHLRNDLTPTQLRTNIVAAWNADSKKLPVDTALKQDLAAAAVPLDTTWKTLIDSKKADEEASRMLAALNGLLNFRNALNRKLGTLDDADQRKAAQDDLDQVIGPLLNHEISARQSAVKDYSTAIGYIGEVVQH
jgi:hypothetical protein